MAVQSRKVYVLFVSVILILAVLPQASIAKDSVLWQQPFDQAESIPSDARVLGNRSTSQSIKIVPKGATPKARSLAVSFVAEHGRSWFVPIPLDLRVDPNRPIMLTGRARYTCGTPANVYFTLHYDVYGDADLTKRYRSAHIKISKGLAQRDIWETLIEEPLRPTQRAREEGRIEPFLKLTRLDLKVLDVPIGEQITIWIDELALEYGTDRHTLAYEQNIKLDQKPSPYPSQVENFYYGYFGHINSGGFHRYHKHHNLIPAELRSLVNIEFLIRGNFNHLVGGVVDATPESLKLVTQNIALGHAYGIYTTPIVPIGPYYPHPGRARKAMTKTAAEKLLKRIVTRLAETPGTNGYLMIDEPFPTIRNRDIWLWGKQLYRSLDPKRPATGPMNTPDRVRLFGPTEHTLWIDEYPLSGRAFDHYGARAGMIFKLEQMNRLAFERGAKQVWNTNQVNGQVRSRRKRGTVSRLPSAAEHRLGNYISLANGGRSLNYYMLCPTILLTLGKGERVRMGTVTGYGFGSSVGAFTHPVGREIERQADVVPVLGPALLGTTWEHKRTLVVSCNTLEFSAPFSKAALGASFNRGDTYDVVVVYNRDAAGPQSGTVDLNSVLAGRNVYDLQEGMPAHVTEGILDTGTLRAGDGKFFVLSPPDVFARLRSDIHLRRYDLRKRAFDFDYREQRHNGLNLGPFKDAFERSRKTVMKDPEGAWNALRSAHEKLLARKTGDSAFAASHELLAATQRAHVDIVEGQAHQLSHKKRSTPLDAICRQPGYLDWERETRQLSDTYILLRNALYFGKAKKVLRLAKKLAPMAQEMATAVREGQFSPVNAKAVADLHARALALNKFDLVKALMENAKD